ncbi:MAG: hypothetical protein PHN75_03955, partial [Syntrophales bacterium]|nr:hypothetical protein [Syntrophales bacterium]
MAAPLRAIEGDHDAKKDASAITLDEVVVSGKRDVSGEEYVTLGSYEHSVTSADRARTSDTAELLSNVPG